MTGSNINLLYPNDVAAIAEVAGEILRKVRQCQPGMAKVVLAPREFHLFCSGHNAERKNHTSPFVKLGFLPKIVGPLFGTKTFSRTSDRLA